MNHQVQESQTTPGTVQLIDLDGNVLNSQSRDKKKDDIVLVPTPSLDPDDPLNWTPKRKLLATSCVVMYAIMVRIPSSAVYSVTSPISKATDLTVHTLITGTGVMVCALNSPADTRLTRSTVLACWLGLHSTVSKMLIFHSIWLNMHIVKLSLCSMASGLCTSLHPPSWS